MTHGVGTILGTVPGCTLWDRNGRLFGAPSLGQRMKTDHRPSLPRRVPFLELVLRAEFGGQDTTLAGMREVVGR